MVADIRDRPDRHDLARSARAPAAHAAHYPVATRDLDQEAARGLRYVRVGRVAHDGRDRRGSARAPPRALRLVTRHLVCREWWPARPLVQWPPSARRDVGASALL